jgi:hypothetical protein
LAGKSAFSSTTSKKQGLRELGNPTTNRTKKIAPDPMKDLLKGAPKEIVAPDLHFTPKSRTILVSKDCELRPMLAILGAV